MENESVDEGTQRIPDCIRLPMPVLEVIGGLMLLAALIWYVLDALKLPQPFNPTDIGAGGFPLLIATATIVPTVIMIAVGVAGLMGKTNQTVTRWYRPFFIIITSLIFIAQAALLETLGVYISVGLFSAAIMLAAGERRPLHILGVPLAVAAFIYVVFALALNVVFP
ncbi:tripartite tricarboxylate transporter TctB family protein [Agrobacterium sp. LAD9]|uniref:tripartite tricarboxylate transporter TctB family protein n=1 Tax=Agrobacterium sp. LAD9 TaxID=2055153 RepID=UPI000D1FBD2F|nr:tripartite tricarboxylate transporter TctB family protein [Agrobacterium sp. LAD9]